MFKISADKIFGGQNFRQQVIFSAVLSVEILSDKVCSQLITTTGVVGVIVAVGKGILRTLLIPGLKNDLVPVDLVSNCILVSVWYHGTTKPTDPFICNCTSGNVNPTTFQDMERTCQGLLISSTY